MQYIKNGRIIGIGCLPGRKKKCLYIGYPGVVCKVASFNDDDAADLFAEYLEYIFCSSGAEDMKGGE